MASTPAKRPNDNNSKVSPYKKFKETKKEYIGYRQMKMFPANIAFKFFNIVPTDHPKYGSGHLGFVRDNKNVKWRVQLPNKTLNRLTPEELDQLVIDIKSDSPPYLVYRRQLDDNSYEIDIIPQGPEIEKQFKSGTEVPELESSVEEGGEDSDKIQKGTGNESKKDEAKEDGQDSDKIQKGTGNESKKDEAKKDGQDSDKIQKGTGNESKEDEAKGDGQFPF